MEELPIADCSRCKRTFTMNETDALVMVDAGTWNCPCGGHALMRDDDVLEAAEEEWLARHRRN